MSTVSVRGCRTSSHRRSAWRVLCGDFNIVPEDRDTSTGRRNPGALNFTDEERCELSALLDSGFADLYAHLHPDGRDRFTYWDYGSNRDRLRNGIRLDLILGTKGVVDRLRGIWVDMDYRQQIDGLRPSECAPLIADLDD